MKKKIIISSTVEQTCVALCENEQLVEYNIEGEYLQSIVGCIFKGCVKQIKRGIQAAFIDIGQEKNAFMYLSPDDKLTEGESILVQVVKDASSEKGSVVSQSISLPGRYAVLMPKASYIGVSKNITERDKREHLEALAQKYRCNNLGIIIRTASLGVDDVEIGNDIERLVKQWQTILAKFKVLNVGNVLYRELDLPIRVIRDYLELDIDGIIVDDENTYKIIKDLLLEVNADLPKKLSLYTAKQDVLDFYGLSEQISAIIDRRVDMPNGGYLIIDYTEALTVIDVNSGKFVGKTSGDSYLQTNIQAAYEIARQIRLRDITGIIIIDFIDMQKEREREQITQLLKDLFVVDKRKPKVVGFTELGLMQITRKKMRKNTFNSLMSDCSYCNGSGKLKSIENVSMEICKYLNALSQKKIPKRSIVLQAHPLLVSYFARKHLNNIQHTLNLKIQLKSVDGMHREKFSVLLATQEEI